LARARRGSRSRARNARRLSREYARITDARQSFLHEVSSQLVKNHARLAIEDLAVHNLLRNGPLARAIENAAWSEFTRQLAYKAEWFGAELVVCDRWFPSSPTCSQCGKTRERMGWPSGYFAVMPASSSWTEIATPPPTSPPGPSTPGLRTAKRAAGSPTPLEGKALTVDLMTV
jgi:IS605 OrfB family transposase